MRLGWWIALSMLTSACSTSGGSDAGSVNPPTDPPTQPAQGTIDGYPFSVVTSYAFWSKSGKTLWIELESYPDNCTQQQIPPDKATVIGIEVPQAMLTPGKYNVQPGSYLVDPGFMTLSAATYPYNDAGLPTNWIADVGSGVVWITSATPTTVTGAFWVNALKVVASGTFSAPICGGAADAGAD